MSFTASLIGKQEIQTLQPARETDLTDNDDHIIGCTTFGGRVKVWLNPSVPGEEVTARISVSYPMGVYQQFGNQYVLHCATDAAQSEVLELYGGPDAALFVYATRIGANNASISLCPCDANTKTGKGLSAIVGTTKGDVNVEVKFIDIESPDNTQS